MEKLIRVNVGYAIYGILVKDGIVIDAAPIAKWMVGKTTRVVRNWLDSKGATYEEVIE